MLYSRKGRLRKYIGVDILAALVVFFIPAEPLCPGLIQYFLTIIVLVSLLIIKKWKIYFDAFAKFQSLFLLLMVVSLIYSPKEGLGSDIIKMNFFTFLRVYSATYCVYTIRKDRVTTTDYILNSFTAGVIAISTYTLFKEWNYLIRASFGWRFGVIVFQNHGTFMMLSYSVIIAMIWCLYKVFECRKYIYIPALIFILIIALFTGTKKIILSLIICILTYIVIKYRKKGLKIIAVGLGVFLLFAITYSLIMHNEFLYSTIGKRIESFVMALSGREQGTISTQERQAMIQYAMELFSESPIIGKGVSAFRYYFMNAGGRFAYSHNNYTEILCNHGLIGFFLYYGFLVRLFLLSYRNLKETHLSIYIFCIVFLSSIFFIDLSQVSYYRDHYLLIYALISILNRPGVDKNQDNQSTHKVDRSSIPVHS